MKTLGKLALAASVITGLGAVTAAQAHGIWFAQRSNQLALIYGVGADDLDMVKRLPKVKIRRGLRRERQGGADAARGQRAACSW